MNTCKKQHGFSPVEAMLVVVIAGVIGGITWYVLRANKKIDDINNKTTASSGITPTAKKSTITKPDTSTDNSSTSSSADTFDSQYEFGTANATGYPSTIKLTEVEPCSSTCLQHDYVFFHIVTSSSANFTNYISTLKGNSYAQDGAIGMGCLSSGVISYDNQSDANGYKHYEISKDDTTKIMAATANAPINLKIEKLKNSAGKDAPTCYSHITTFTVLN